MTHELSSTDVRDAILRFLNGDVQPCDWDDFTSARIRDPFLDAVRLLCVHVRDAYPPVVANCCCSDAGADLMREVANRLPVS